MKGIYLINAVLILFWIAIELLYCLVKKKQYYKYNDSVTSLSSYFSADIINIALQVPILAFYVFLAANYTFMPISKSSAIAWITAIVLIDLIYYWWHRFSHTVSILWAFHVTHHQSEEFNLAVAVRKGWLTKVTFALFYLPLILIGFPVEMILVGAALLSTYQFYLHVRSIGKLGFLEKFMCTPSHHRVHHGRNEKYLGRNYGGIFIVWDKLFGTFQQEEEEPDYGMPVPLKSDSLLWANFHYWVEIYRISKKLDTFSDKVKIWFMPPGWKEELSDDGNDAVNMPELTSSLKLYQLCQFFIALGLSVYISENYKVIPFSALLFLSLFSLFTFVSVCVLAEKHSWALSFETLKYFLLIFFIFFYSPVNIYFVSVITVLSVLFIVWLLSSGKLFRYKPVKLTES